MNQSILIILPVTVVVRNRQNTIHPRGLNQGRKAQCDQKHQKPLLPPGQRRSGGGSQNSETPIEEKTRRWGAAIFGGGTRCTLGNKAGTDEGFCLTFPYSQVSCQCLHCSSSVSPVVDEHKEEEATEADGDGQAPRHRRSENRGRRVSGEANSAHTVEDATCLKHTSS